ncbi:MAG: UDP-galactopyranose mutase, partial [Bdellovibrionota bacterium]
MTRANFSNQDNSTKLRPELDIVCLSHLRWNFVYQRPQHLLSRAAASQRIFFFEEPVYHDSEAFLEMRTEKQNLVVAVPHLPHGLSEAEAIFIQEKLLFDMLDT